MSDKPVETAPEAPAEEILATIPEVSAEGKKVEAKEVKPEETKEETKEVKTEEVKEETKEVKTEEVKTEVKTEAKVEEVKTEVKTEAKVEETKEVKPEKVEAKVEKPAEKAAPAQKTPIQTLWAIAQEHAHSEIWGVTLADPETHVPSQIVFQKYLNANDGDLTKAKDQLVKTLDWRAKTKPLELLKQAYDGAKFGGLGYVTTYTTGETYDPAVPESKEVFTWNVYGNVKSTDKTFGNLQEFINWRVALMELALQDLSLATATKAITADYDPYKIFQVHDYKSISFLRQSPVVKAASVEVIKVFAVSYPELLKEKFFVNVPAIMGFIYSFMKLFVAAKTIKKFHPMSNGAALGGEFTKSQIKDLGQRLPKEYGGKAGELKAVGKETALLTASKEASESEGETKKEVKPAAEAKAAPVEVAAAPVEAKAEAPAEVAAPVEVAKTEAPAEAAKAEAPVAAETPVAETKVDGEVKAEASEAKTEATEVKADASVEAKAN